MKLPLSLAIVALFACAYPVRSVPVPEFSEDYYDVDKTTEYKYADLLKPFTFSPFASTTSRTTISYDSLWEDPIVTIPTPVEEKGRLARFKDATVATLKKVGSGIKNFFTGASS